MSIESEWRVSRAPSFLFLLLALFAAVSVGDSGGTGEAVALSFVTVHFCTVAWIKRNEFAVKGIW